MPTAVAVVMLALVAGTGGWGDEPRAPMNLRECVDFALQASPRIEASRASAEAAGARIGQARAARRSQLGLSAGYSDSDPAPAGQRKYSAVATLGKLLYDSGRTDALTSRERRLHEANRHVLREVELDVAFETARSYFAVLRAHRLVGVAEEQLDSASRHRDLATARYEVGVVARADVIRSEVDVARQRLALVQAQTAVQVALAQLINVMGMEHGAPLQIVDIADLPPPPSDLDPAVRRAHEGRPEALAARAEAEAAGASVRAARTGLSPQVNARAEVGFRDDSFFLGDSAWSLGVTATMPLSDGGDTRSRVAEAQAQRAALDAERDEVRRRIALEVTQAVLAVREALESVAVAQEHVRLARHNMELAQGRYGVGEGSFIEVTDARAALTEALTGEAKALYDAHVAHAALARATGAMPIGEEVGR